MLNLLKVEFLYSRYLKISIGPLAGLVMYYILFVELERIYAIVAVLFFIFLMAIYSPWKIEKRVRKLSLLPIPLSEIAKARILIVLFPLIIVYSILSVTIPIPFYEQIWEKSFAELFFLFGLSVIGGGIKFFMNDILPDYKLNERIIFNVIIFILAIVLIIMISMICVNSFKSNLIMGYIIISCLVILSLVFLYSTINSFLGRPSYLE